MATKVLQALVRAPLAVAAATARSAATTQRALATAATAAHSPLGPAAGEPHKRVLYATHMPTTPTQKIFLSVASALSVFADPERGDMLAALGEVTGTALYTAGVDRSFATDR